MARRMIDVLPDDSWPKSTTLNFGTSLESGFVGVCGVREVMVDGVAWVVVFDFGCVMVTYELLVEMQ